MTAYAGEPIGREGQPLSWRHPDDLDPKAFPAADRPIITALRLPSRYLISGDDPAEPAVFLARLARSLAEGIELVQLRAHDLPDADYAALAFAARDLCRRQGARLLLNRDPARALGAGRRWSASDWPAFGGPAGASTRMAPGGGLLSRGGGSGAGGGPGPGLCPPLAPQAQVPAPRGASSRLGAVRGPGGGRQAAGLCPGGAGNRRIWTRRSSGAPRASRRSGVSGQCERAPVWSSW